MGVRTGAEYIASLDDGRCVFVDGERVSDVARHPAFSAAVRTIASLYDLSAGPEKRELMTFPSPATGDPVNKSFLIPRSRDDLVARRRFHKTWADASFGLFGRSPDHVACYLTAFAARSDLFERGGKRFAENVVRYYEYVRDNDLYVTYLLIPPQIDRSKPMHQQDDPTAYAGVVDEREDGI